MNSKYPWGMILVGVVINFLLRNLPLLAAGVILCFIGNWLPAFRSVGIAVLLLDLILSIIQQIQISQEAMAELGNHETSEESLRAAQAQEEQAHAERQAILQKLVVYRTLRASVTEAMNLEELVGAFEKMCETFVGDPDDLLYETGTFDFSGEKHFYFSLVRQFRFLDPDEYVQLRLEVQYLPCSKTFFLPRVTWGNRTDGTFFDNVRGSREFQAVKELPILRVDIRIEET